MGSSDFLEVYWSCRTSITFINAFTVGYSVGMLFCFGLIFLVDLLWALLSNNSLFYSWYILLFPGIPIFELFVYCRSKSILVFMSLCDCRSMVLLEVTLFFIVKFFLSIFPNVTFLLSYDSCILVLWDKTSKNLKQL